MFESPLVSIFAPQGAQRSHQHIDLACHDKLPEDGKELMTVKRALLNQYERATAQELLTAQVEFSILSLAKWNDFDLTEHVPASAPLRSRLMYALDMLLVKEGEPWLLVPLDFEGDTDLPLVRTSHLTNSVIVGRKTPTDAPGVIVVWNQDDESSDVVYASVVEVGYYPQKQYIELPLTSPK